MIRKYKVKGSRLIRKAQADPFFYAVESEVYPELVYVMDDKELALLRGSDAWRLPWEDVKTLASLAIDEGLEEEMLDLIKDHDDLLRMAVNLENIKRYVKEERE